MDMLCMNAATMIEMMARTRRVVTSAEARYVETVGVVDVVA